MKSGRVVDITELLRDNKDLEASVVNIGCIKGELML